MKSISTKIRSNNGLGICPYVNNIQQIHKRELQINVSVMVKEYACQVKNSHHDKASLYSLAHDLRLSVEVSYLQVKKAQFPPLLIKASTLFCEIAAKEELQFQPPQI